MTSQLVPAVVATIATASALAWPVGPAVAEDEHVDFAIAAQSLDDALTEFSKQADVTVMAPAAVTAGKTSPGVAGRLSVEAALERLLDGADLNVVRDESGAIFIEPTRDEPEAPDARPLRESALSVDTIVITALQREERARDVAASVSVISGDLLEAASVRDFTELEFYTPGLNLDVINDRSNSIAIRGVPFEPSSNATPAAETYWNDVRVNPSQALFRQFFDIDRVELLRGPQGVLQGRAAPAGSIGFVTAGVDLDAFGGYVAGSVSDLEQRTLEGALNAPVAPGVFGVRLAGHVDSNDVEKIHNVTLDQDESAESWAARLSAAWTPSDRFSARFTAETDSLDLTAFDAVAGAGAGRPALDRFDRVALQQRADVTDMETTKGVLSLEWSGWGHRFESISGLVDFDIYSSEDRDESNATPGLGYLSQVTQESEQLSQEFRIYSDNDRRWSYILGFLYVDRDSMTWSEGDFRSATDGQVTTVAEIPIETTEYAVFTHHRFDITDRWRVQGGLRWQDIDVFNAATATAGANFPGGRPRGSVLNMLISEDRQNTSYDAVTGSIDVSYRYGADSLLYAAYQTSYRPGGVTITGTATLSEDLLIFDEERSSNLELGAKTAFAGGRVLADVVVFRQEFDDFIQRVTDIPLDLDLDGAVDIAAGLPRTVSVTVNGDATVTGAELSGTALVTDALTLSGSLSYADGEYKDGVLIPCGVYDAGGAPIMNTPGSQVSLCDAGGRPIGDPPRWSATAALEYVRPLGELEGFFNMQAKYSGERVSNSVGMEAAPYALANVSAGVRAPAGWELSIWAKNVFDTDAERAQFDLVEDGYRALNLVPPRVVGVSARYEF